MAYYKQEDYEKSIPWFKRASVIQPGMSTAYMGLADTYIALKQWENAKNACIDGILVYPDAGYFVRLGTIADKMDKVYRRHWQEHIVTPNDVTLTQTPPNTGPWVYYRSAKDKIADYCNDDGVITKSIEFTQQKYLEVYSWEYMLKKSTPAEEDDYKEMEFARKMQTEGYLDCYAFVSCYHVNFHKQYKDFSKHNADRIRTYINTYLLK
jgi:tetratricopeptide (TPR) repeat protein